MGKTHKKIEKSKTYQILLLSPSTSIPGDLSPETLSLHNIIMSKSQRISGPLYLKLSYSRWKYSLTFQVLGFDHVRQIIKNKDLNQNENWLHVFLISKKIKVQNSNFVHFATQLYIYLRSSKCVVKSFNSWLTQPLSVVVQTRCFSLAIIVLLVIPALFFQKSLIEWVVTTIFSTSDGLLVNSRIFDSKLNVFQNILD